MTLCGNCWHEHGRHTRCEVCGCKKCKSTGPEVSAAIRRILATRDTLDVQIRQATR